MQCAERFSDSATSQNLNQSQMIALLSLSEDDTSKFIEEHATSGSPGQNMSIKNLRSEIKQWKSARKKLAPVQSSDNEMVETIDISPIPVTTHHDTVEQSVSNNQDNISINNTEPSELATINLQKSSLEIQSSDYTSSNSESEILKTPTEIKGIYLIESISSMCSSLVQHENRNEILRDFAEHHSAQLDSLIQNLNTIISELQVISNKD